HDPDHAGGAPACRALDVAVVASRRHPTQRPRAGGRRPHSPARGVILRRARGRDRPAADAGRGGVGRTGGARPRELRQLRRLARAASAVRRAQAARRRTAAPSHREIRDGRSRSLGARASSTAGDVGIAGEAASEHVEHVARTLLLRYGVVFWRLIEREAAWLPPWRDLLRVYRRLE